MEELKDNEVVLPDYLPRLQGGIYVDLSKFPSGGGFAGFLDTLFGSGSRFQGLDYELLTNLLYHFDAILGEHGASVRLKLAERVVDFTPTRRALYKAVKVDAQGTHAEYLFEPVQIEVVREVPVYGEPGEDGVAPIVGSAHQTESQPTQLDPEEFVADMWTKGVRFGIDYAGVANAISRGDVLRMEIARSLDATEGCDAEVEEATEALRRDNSPKKLPNGKADLRRFQNRFPQISAGARLLKKKKRILGKPGFKVSGAVIEPALPADFDLLELAGEGTKVENQGANEFIVATRDGFLSLDTETNHIAVTEKIENKAGVSIKTTGDLSLAGDDFVEHGEVQEGRVVEGKHMTFRSDVYGSIASQGGRIVLEKNLSGGSARSLGGDITSNGRLLNSVVEAWSGTVTAKYAEGCLIMGESVNIERAVNCEIIGKNVQVESAEGCGIAGKDVRIKSSGACRDKQTIVFMLVPSLTSIDAQINQAKRAIVECRQAAAAKDQELAQIEADEGVAKYLALEASIRQGGVKLTPAQQENWRKMTANFASTRHTMERLKTLKQEQLQRVPVIEQNLAQLLQAREKSGEGIHCHIAEVVGDTRVRTMVAPRGVSGFQQVEAGELRIKLREPGHQAEQVFMDSEGSLDWRYELPEVTLPTDKDQSG